MQPRTICLLGEQCLWPGKCAAKCARYHPEKKLNHRATEVERLRAGLEWYRNATASDFANDNGYKAASILDSLAE